MPAIRETTTLPYSAEQMFDLVADVARYDEFLPWVVGVRIKSESESEMIADLLVGFKALREKFTSKVLKNRPHSIEVIYLDGPMKDLDNCWTFRPCRTVDVKWTSALISPSAAASSRRWLVSIWTAHFTRWSRHLKSARLSFTAAAVPARPAQPDGGPRRGPVPRTRAALPHVCLCCVQPSRTQQFPRASARFRHQARRYR